MTLISFLESQYSKAALSPLETWMLGYLEPKNLLQKRVHGLEKPSGSQINLALKDIGNSRIDTLDSITRARLRLFPVNKLDFSAAKSRKSHDRDTHSNRNFQATKMSVKRCLDSLIDQKLISKDKAPHLYFFRMPEGVTASMDGYFLGPEGFTRRTSEIFRITSDLFEINRRCMQMSRYEVKFTSDETDRYLRKAYEITNASTFLKRQLAYQLLGKYILTAAVKDGFASISSFSLMDIIERELEIILNFVPDSKKPFIIENLLSSEISELCLTALGGYNFFGVIMKAVDPRPALVGFENNVDALERMLKLYEAK